MFNLRKNRKGFTLIELIVVIAIIAILAAVAIPTFVGLTKKADNAVLTANATSIASSINVYNTLNPDAMIADADLADAGALATTLGDLWPTGIDDAASSCALITIANGVAQVTPAE